MSIFGKKSVPESVQKELKSRKDSIIQWNGKKFPWIVVTSMSDKVSQEYTTLSSFSGALYETNYVRPKPGILDLKIQKLGELGTTKKATLKLIAYTDEQLIELQKGYFIPGMNVRVEWGWSTSAAKLQGVNTIGERKIDVPEVYKRIKRKTSVNPNYEGLQGRVGNFSYTLNTNNQWECDLEIISAAELFANAKVNDYSCPKCVGYKDGDEEKPEKISTLYTAFAALSEEKQYTKATQLYGLKDVYRVVYYGESTDLVKQTQAQAGFWSKAAKIVSDFVTDKVTATFISWHDFETLLNERTAIKNESDYSYGSFNSDKSKIAYNQVVLSADPRICILPGTNNDASKGGFIEYSAGGAPYTCVDNKLNKINLQSILLNTVFLANKLHEIENSGDGAISTYVKAVLEEINRVCGSLWEFQIVNGTEESDASKVTLTVIDAKDYETSNVYVVPAKPENSIVRELTFQMKLTEGMKSQALYSKKEDGPKSKSEAGSGCGNGLVFEGFRLYNNEQILDLSTSTASKTSTSGTPLVYSQAYSNTQRYDVTSKSFSAKTDLCGPCEELNEEKKEAPNYWDFIEKLKEEVNDTNASSMISEMIALYNQPDNKSHCNGIILPFDFGFTVDGIGGLSFGQMISCDRIPKQIRDVYDFQITIVEHSVTPNDWTTSVKTVARWKTKPQSNSNAIPPKKEKNIKVEDDVQKINTKLDVGKI